MGGRDDYQNYMGGEEMGDDDTDGEGEPPMKTVLIIGRSNTGKSNLVRNIIREYESYEKVVYVVNDRSRHSPYSKIQWHQLQEINSCILVVEDVMSATTKQYRSLQELLNFQAHHLRVNPILVVSHSLHRQNLSGLLGSFTHVCISAYKSNIRSLRQLLAYYVFEKEEKQAHLKTLLTWNRPYSHFILDVEKRELKMRTYDFLPPNQKAKSAASGREKKRDSKREKKALYQGRKMTERDAVAYERANFFLGEKLVKNPKKAYALFEIVYPQLVKKSVDVKTLTVTLRRLKGGHLAKISLIDYVSTLTDPSQKPTELVSLFHRYVLTARCVTLPTTYLANKLFW